MRGTVNDNVLANDVIVADSKFTSFATEVEILWQSTQHGPLMHLVIVAHASAIEHAGEWEKDAVVAYHHIIFYIHEWEYLTVVTNLCFWRHFCSWTNFT